MKLSNILKKVAMLLKRAEHLERVEGKEKKYSIRTVDVKIIEIPYSAFLVIRKYGFIVFFYKTISFLSEFLEKHHNDLENIKYIILHPKKTISANRRRIYFAASHPIKFLRKYSNGSLSVFNPAKVAVEIFHKQQSEFSREDLIMQMALFDRRPFFSVVIPVYNTPDIWLERMLRSIQAQVYDNWELCIVDDCSTNPEPRKIIETFAKDDARIKFKFSKENGGISRASNHALSMAKGEYVALVDHDDELTPDALFWFANEINKHPNADFIYSDECKISAFLNGEVFDFQFKPDWSPEMLLNMMYTGHLTVYRRSLIESVGRFRSKYDFSQDYDLALRISEKTKEIFHIERVLYLWRAIDGSAAKGGKDFARISNIAALEDSANRRGISAKVKENPHCNYLNILGVNREKISIIVPTDSYQNLKRCLDGILSSTVYPDYEIVAVCNSKLVGRIAGEYAHFNNVRFSRYDKPFNFSEKCNQGAQDGFGSILVFLNDDVIPRSEDWLEILTEYLYLPGIGGVSPKLVLEDDRIQYAGMVTGTPGLIGTAYNGQKKDDVDGFLSMHRFVRDVTVLSGACLAIKKSIFNDVGFFNHIDTPNGHSDADLSFRILDRGLRCVYTPHVLLTHIGNHTWHSGKKEKDKSDIYLLKKWGKYLHRDPYFTDSMKSVLYGDFRYIFKIFSETVNTNRVYTGKDIALLSHDLSLSGAPRMLFLAANILMERGHFCVVIAPQDGPIRLEYEALGIPVIVNEALFRHDLLTERFLKNFDLILVNTIVGYPIINQLSDYNIPLVWWLHEAMGLEEYLNAGNTQSIAAFKRSDGIIAVSDYADGFLGDFSSKSIVIWNGMEDAQSITGNCQRDVRKKIRVCLVGSIEPRKGQDVLVGAVASLSASVRRNVEFHIMGRKLPSLENFHSSLVERAATIPEIYFHEAASHDDALRFIESCDVLICPSLDDPSPLVVTEAIMFRKLVVISENVGTKGKLMHGSSCLIFKTGSEKELAKMIRTFIEDPKIIESYGEEARKIYEKNFLMKQFSENFCNYIENFF